MAPQFYLKILLIKVIGGWQTIVEDWLDENISFANKSVENATLEHDWWRIQLEQLEDGVAVLFVTPLYEE